MSKLVALRIPDELLASIDAMAQAEGMNRSQAIIALLGEGGLPPIASGVVELKAVELENVKTVQKPVQVEAIPSAVYQRPAHAENCRCFQCKPPR